MSNLQSSASRPQFRSRKKTEGFTVMEVLIAVAMGSVILSSLYWAYATVAGTTRRYREVSDFYQTARIVLTNMAREISGAFQPVLSKEQLMFQGNDEWFKGREADSLNFVSTTSFRGGTEETGSDSFELGYYLGFGEQEGLLLMRRAPHYNLEEPFEEGEELVLAENVRGLNFEYFDGIDWLEKWSPEEQENLPRAVRISLTLGREDEEEPRRFTTATWLPLAGEEEEEEEEEAEK